MRECLQQDTKTKSLILFTNLQTETRLREEQRLKKDQQYKNVRRKTPGKPLWTHKPITSWVKTLAHRDEVKTPGLIWAKCIEYIRQKWKEQQKDQILLHTYKPTNLKRTKIMPFGITPTQKNKYDEQIKLEKPEVSIDTTITPETNMTKEANKIKHSRDLPKTK